MDINEIAPISLIRFRVVDVGTEWRTFSNEKAAADPSRVGAAQVRKTLKTKI